MNVCGVLFETAATFCAQFQYSLRTQSHALRTLLGTMRMSRSRGACFSFNNQSSEHTSKRQRHDAGGWMTTSRWLSACPHALLAPRTRSPCEEIRVMRGIDQRGSSYATCALDHLASAHFMHLCHNHEVSSVTRTTHTESAHTTLTGACQN